MVRDLSLPTWYVLLTLHYPQRVKIPFRWDLEAPSAAIQPLNPILCVTGHATVRTVKNKKRRLKAFPTAQAPELQESNLVWGSLLDEGHFQSKKWGHLVYESFT